MIDRDMLLAYAIADGRQQVTEAAHAFYALSVGFGQDPLDEKDLRFVSAGYGLVPTPTVALVLAHPGFWLADPETGVDASRVVHADQNVEIVDAIPIDGLVTSQTRLTALVDKGVGKAAILYTETVLRGEEGRVFARLRRATLARGQGGCGNWGEAPAPASLSFDDAPSATQLRATRAEQALLYRLNGDLNPLHSDPVQARAAGFDRPILHGLCTLGVIGHALLADRDHDPARLATMHARFVAPVFPGESLHIDMWQDGRFRATAVERDVVVATGKAG